MTEEIDLSWDIIFASSKPNVSRVISSLGKKAKGPDAYIMVMSKLQKFSDNLYVSDFAAFNEYLRKCDACANSSQKRLEIIERFME